MSIQKRRLKRGDRYRAIIQVGAKQISKSFGRKLDAEVWHRQQATLRDQGLPNITSRNSMTVGDLGRHWLDEHSKRRKAASSFTRDEGIFRLQILPHFERKKLVDLSPSQVEGWMNRLREGARPLAPKTCNQCLGLLKKMLNDAVRWRFLNFNPILSVRQFRLAQQEFQFWNSQEIAQFLRHIEVEEPDRYGVFMLALNSGMRRGELRALTWDCVDLEQRQITVKASWCFCSQAIKGTKSGLIRRIPINSRLRALLIDLRRQRRGEYVFDGVRFLNSTRDMERLCRGAGVRSIRFHDTRHTFASQFVMKGGDIYVLQKLLGHSTIRMTERYSHLSPEHLAGQTEILNFGPAKDVVVMPPGVAAATLPDSCQGPTESGEMTAMSGG